LIISLQEPKVNKRNLANPSNHNQLDNMSNFEKFSQKTHK